MFCSNCGERIENADVCPNCGHQQTADTETMNSSGTTAHGTNAQPTVAATATSAESFPTASIEEHVAGALAYVLGWITGIIFLILDKREFVRFHAAQSLLATGVLSILSFIASRIFRLLFWRAWFIFSGILIIFNLAIVGLAVFLIYQAYQKKRFKLPIIGDLAEKLIQSFKV